MIFFLRENCVLYKSLLLAPHNPPFGVTENVVHTFKSFLKKSKKKSGIKIDNFKFILNYNCSNYCSIKLICHHQNVCCYQIIDKKLAHKWIYNYLCVLENLNLVNVNS